MVVLRDMVNMYKDLKLVLMSATIDTSLFVEYFGHCHIVEVHGRQHPVQGMGECRDNIGVVKLNGIEYFPLNICFSFVDYFLEDCIQMLNFVTPPNSRKRKHGDDGDDAPAEADVDVSMSTKGRSFM